MKPIALKENETTTIIIELDFSRENITKDWSLVAKAAKGSVTVRHSKGLKSQSFPYIERKESSSSTTDSSTTTAKTSTETTTANTTTETSTEKQT